MVKRMCVEVQKIKCVFEESFLNMLMGKEKKRKRVKSKEAQKAIACSKTDWHLELLPEIAMSVARY